MAQYAARLGQVFKYVIQFPVKVRLSHIAKYRMIYGTNHEDGLLLMADNMARRWKEFRESVRPQGVLFEMDFPDQTVKRGVDDVREHILGALNGRTPLKELLVQLVQRFGVSFSLSELTAVMKTMAKQNDIKVLRVPELLPSGKPITGWDYTGRDGFTVYIERSVQWQRTLL